jgi:hypothetical protein
VVVGGVDVLGDADVLGLGLDEAVVARADGVGARVQWAAGVGPGFGLVTALTAGLGVGLDVGVGAEVSVALGLELAVDVLLGLAPPLVLAPALPLAVVVAGVVPGPVVWSAGLDFCATAAFDELGVQGDPVARLVAPVDAPLLGVPPPMRAPDPVLADPDGVLCELRPCSTEWTISCRSGGTAASTTPTANTAKPTANAGRSIASRQSWGCCRACPGAVRRADRAAGPPRSARQRRARAAWPRRISSTRTPALAAPSAADAGDRLAVA